MVTIGNKTTVGIKEGLAGIFIDIRHIGLEGHPYGYLENFIAHVILSLLILIVGILFFKSGEED